MTEATASVIRPMGRFATRPQPLKVQAIIEENYRIKTFIFDGEMPSAKPGQFVMTWLPRLDEKPFSLVYHMPVTLTIVAVGPFSNAMHDLKVGDSVWFRGPFGQPFEQIGQRPVLVGSDYEVMQLTWLAQEQQKKQQMPIAVIGGQQAADVIGVARFEALEVPVIIRTNDGSLGESCLITQSVESLLMEQAVDSICAVGPHDMLHALEQLAKTYQIPAQLLWKTYMGCAIGLCGRCEHEDGSLLCIEGPIRHVKAAK